MSTWFLVFLLYYAFVLLHIIIFELMEKTDNLDLILQEDENPCSSRKVIMFYFLGFFSIGIINIGNKIEFRTRRQRVKWLERKYRKLYKKQMKITDDSANAFRKRYKLSRKRDEINEKLQELKTWEYEVKCESKSHSHKIQRMV